MARGLAAAREVLDQASASKGTPAATTPATRPAGAVATFPESSSEPVTPSTCTQRGTGGGAADAEEGNEKDSDESKEEESKEMHKEVSSEEQQAAQAQPPSSVMAGGTLRGIDSRDTTVNPGMAGLMPSVGEILAKHDHERIEPPWLVCLLIPLEDAQVDQQARTCRGGKWDNV